MLSPNSGLSTKAETMRPLYHQKMSNQVGFLGFRRRGAGRRRRGAGYRYAMDSPLGLLGVPEMPDLLAAVDTRLVHACSGGEPAFSAACVRVVSGGGSVSGLPSRWPSPGWREHSTPG